MITNPEDVIHGSGSASKGAKAGGALGAVAVTVKRDLDGGLGGGDGEIGKSPWLERAVEFFGRGGGKPAEFEAFG